MAHLMTLSLWLYLAEPELAVPAIGACMISCYCMQMSAMKGSSRTELTHIAQSDTFMEAKVYESANFCYTSFL